LQKLISPTRLAFQSKTKALIMPQNHFYSCETQVSWACKALLDGRTISHQSQAKEAGGWRLGAIIHNLRNRYSWPIETAIGPGCIALYRLADDCDPAALEYPPSAKCLSAKGGAA
jgi:hypothetical protein